MTAVRVATVPEPAGIPYRDDRYAAHASPASIRVYLAKARHQQARAERVVAWLEDLLARREAEVEAGIWPPSVAVDALDGTR